MVSTHVKNISQMGNLPQIGVKIKNIGNHHLEKRRHGKTRENQQHLPGKPRIPLFLRQLDCWFYGFLVAQKNRTLGVPGGCKGEEGLYGISKR